MRNIVINYCQKVNDFARQNYEKIKGTLTIGSLHGEGSVIVNINELSFLTRVEKDLITSNTVHLDDLDGLKNILFLGGVHLDIFPLSHN